MSVQLRFQVTKIEASWISFEDFCLQDEWEKKNFFSLWKHISSRLSTQKLIKFIRSLFKMERKEALCIIEKEQALKVPKTTIMSFAQTSRGE